jgi:hypothetical protein
MEKKQTAKKITKSKIKKMKKYLRTAIAIAAATAILLLSCHSLPFSGSKTLTVKTVAQRGRAAVVTFKEIKGEWILPTDTLAPGKTVTINFIHQ